MLDFKKQIKRITILSSLIFNFQFNELCRRREVYNFRKRIENLKQYNVDPLQIAKDLLVRDNFGTHPQNITSGPFKGLVLETDSWSRGDLVSIISGNYEKEVVDWISKRGPFDLVVSLGAGTGFYPLGLLHANLAKFAILYEINLESQRIASANAQRNELHSRCKFFGEATPQNILSIIDKGDISIVICDIEGGEFELFSEDVLDEFRNSYLVIEIHDFSSTQKIKYQDLVKRVKMSHHLEILTNLERNPHAIKEIDSLNENMRWLLISEGRPKQMQWLCCSPH